MKKTICLLFTAALLAACHVNSYKIEGTVVSQALPDSSKIYIKQRVVRQWIDKDSAIIRNGKFSFFGQVDTAYFAYLYAENEGIVADLIVEPGNIVVVVDSDEVYSIGTPQNDVYQEYKNWKTTHNAVQVNSECEMEQWYAEDVQADINFIFDHINTLLGNYVFTRTYYSMSIAQKDSVLAAMNDASKQYDRIPLIMEGLAIEKKTSVGQLFTDIVLPDVKGNSLALSSVVRTSNYVLIDFWASWCGPCRASFPALTALYNNYIGTGRFEIFGVSLDSDARNWMAAIDKFGLKWKHVSDLQGWESAGAKLYGVNAIPSTVLIDKNGIIVGRNMQITEIEKLLETAQ